MMYRRSAALLSLLLSAACGGAQTDDQALGPDARVAGNGPDAGSPRPSGDTRFTAYRFDTLSLIDPHLWAMAGPFCIDITTIVNGFATKVLEEDGLEPFNGMLDGSIALVFDHMNVAPDATNDVDLEVPACSAPADLSVCTGTAETPRYMTKTKSQATGACMEVLGGTATDTPRVPLGPCFATSATTFDLEFLGAKIHLRDARGAATFAGDRLEDGLIRGFLSKADAEALQLTIPNNGTRSIASFLEGGGSCHDSAANPRGDRDLGPNGEDGWYIYVAFSAVKVPYLAR